jgi:hypothetical protein
MNAKRSAVLVAIAAIFLLTSCSGVKNVCTTNCGQNGDATLGVTLAAVPLTPPPGTSILSFVVTINSVSLTPAGGGSDVAIGLNTGSYIVDLARLESDSAFLGIASANIPSGTYNKLSVNLDAAVTYCAATSGTAGCKAGSVAQFTKSFATPTTSNFSMTFSANEQASLQLRINFNNALTVNSGTQAVTAVDLTATDVVTTATLPLATSTLATGQQDFVDDVTGVVTAASGSSVSVETATQGTITVAINNSSVFGSACVIPPTAPATCGATPAVGQVASIDAALDSNGTGTLLVYDPINASSIDLIEGVDTTLNTSSTQFQIATNAIVRANSGSLIGSLSLGDTVNVTLAAGASAFIDSHGLPVGTFTGGTATGIFPGQTVALHVTSFTAKSGATPASATVDIVVLRFTRVPGTVTTGSGGLFNIGSLPAFFGQTGSSEVQLSSGSPSTELDGYASSGAITSGDNVSIRALFFGNSSVPAFSAAKVRKN